MRALIVAILLLLAPSAWAGGSHVESDLLRVSGLGNDARVQVGIGSNTETVVGVVLGNGTGKLLVLRRLPSGQYVEEARSAEFPNGLGTHYYIEVIEVTGRDRVTIQVNSEGACGVQVERFRIARSEGSWKVAGYDRADPDTQTCDVNLKSRDYSANLLTRRVLITDFMEGKPMRTHSRRSKIAAPKLTDFSFSMFENEP